MARRKDREESSGNREEMEVSSGKIDLSGGTVGTRKYISIGLSWDWSDPLILRFRTGRGEFLEFHRDNVFIGERERKGERGGAKCSVSRDADKNRGHGGKSCAIKL